MNEDQEAPNPKFYWSKSTYSQISLFFIKITNSIKTKLHSRVVSFKHEFKL